MSVAWKSFIKNMTSVRPQWDRYFKRCSAARRQCIDGTPHCDFTITAFQSATTQARVCCRSRCKRYGRRKYATWAIEWQYRLTRSFRYRIHLSLPAGKRVKLVQLGGMATESVSARGEGYRRMTGGGMSACTQRVRWFVGVCNATNSVMVVGSRSDRPQRR